MMLRSVRARLTLWHTTVLAVLLGLFAVGAYTFVVRTSRLRTDAEVADAVFHLRTELVAERPQQPSTQAAAEEMLQELHFRHIAFAVFDSVGRVVAKSDPPPPDSAGVSRAPLAVAQLAKLVRSGAAVGTRVISLPDQDGGFRAAMAEARLPDGRYVVGAAVSLHDEEETLAEARHAMYAAIPATLALASLGGWLLARHSLAPMVTVRERAARIGATNLSERVPIRNPGDEVGQLAAVINDLLARLELAFERQRQFMADASHELRTPIAVIQHEASLALSRSPRPAEEYEDSLSIVRDAGRRMRLIVEDLFLLAAADAGDMPVRRGPLYLDELVAECTRAVRSLAERRGIHLVTTFEGESPYSGDEALLHRAVLNLLDNAIKHSPSGATVTLRLDRRGAWYRIEVADTGPGVPAELRARIFERFVRADAARSHADGFTSGAGLGLSIARWIAEAHEGELDLIQSSDAGAVFALELPVDLPPGARNRMVSH
jgi:heavy metal sensor kinase